MTASPEFPPARVYTTWGTRLYISEAGELRHGPDDHVPESAVLSQNDDGSVRIDWTGDAGEWAVDFAEDGVGPSKAVLDSGASLELVPLERGLFGLRYRGKYLCAEPDGSVTATKVRCSTWEFFLASEMWCGCGDVKAAASSIDIDIYSLRRYIVDPGTRVKTRVKSSRPRVLVYGYPYWSHGRVYYDVMRRYWRAGVIIDIANWQVDHSAYFQTYLDYYDFIMAAPDGVRTLLDAYNVPPHRLIVVSHHENDIRMLTEQKGRDIFNQFAAYGVVSYYVYCASMMQGVQRKPRVVSLGVEFTNFFAPVAANLRVAGYASSMSVVTFGVEWKRGYLAEAAAKTAGLEFKIAGSTGNQVSFHDMPEFYKTVDAVLTSSISEAAQLPCMEGAAAGRLVIGTPVGHFPLRAYQGGGIIAPIEEKKFISFVSDTLAYYRDNPAAYRDKCQRIQDAARQFDWDNSFHEWLELLSQAERSRVAATAM